MDEICQASKRARVEVGSRRCCDTPALGPRAGPAKRPLSVPDLHCLSVEPGRVGGGGGAGPGVGALHRLPAPGR